MKKIAMLGLGVSGQGVVSYCQRRGIEVVGVDEKEGTELDSLAGVDLVVLSPGIPRSHRWVQRAVAAGVEVVGEAKFALLRIANESMVGLTATNGKTTTVRLIEHVLRCAGRKARSLGNVGTGLTSYVDAADPEEILVVELSSYQLEDLDLRCFEVGAILNITPNHLDRYASMQEYAQAKLRLEQCVRKELFISEQVRRDFGVEGTVFGRPENESAARLVCAHFGVSNAQFDEGMKSFKKPLHRVEWVAEIDGIAYYNDSKATSVAAVLHAVEQLPGPLVLLLGGVDKRGSYRPWIEPFRRKARAAVVFGQAAEVIAQELGNEVELQMASTLEEAVMLARDFAKRGDQIVLSPGCSSLDQFRGYEHRGEEFKRMVREWSEKRQF